MDNTHIRDCFIKAVHAFKNRPPMLKQVFHDAKMYKDQGVLSDADISMLRTLSSQHQALRGVDFSKQV
jgi:rRNA maturation endonuclease Nob1